MEPQRYLRCLGQPALFTASGEPIRFRTRKHLALLVYIAVEDRPHRRDRLAELLWPRVSAREARHSLATGLSVLRAKVGVEALETSRDQVRLVPGSLRLDIERLQAKDVLGTELSGPLEVAAFLDGFEIADSTEFMHWKDRQQARLLPVIKDALLVLIDRCRRTGDTRQIEQLADRMLVIDELSEEAIRAKMEARAFAGDRLTALEVFEAWRKKLWEELQAVPSELIEGIAVRLRRRTWERTTLANIPNVPTDQWLNRPFVGRQFEYRTLYELWDGARVGKSGHALILGDSGIGKTTLVERLTTAAGLEGAGISRVQCYDIEREVPYSTVSGLILGLLDSPGISATSPDALAEISRMVPRVRQKFPNLPEPQDASGETARIRLTEALLEMLTALTEERPIVLVIDDLHLADDVSLAVLHIIVRRSRGRPLMMVLLARPGELAQSNQASQLRENASVLGLQEIELPALSDPESRVMLQSLIAVDEAKPSLAEQRMLLQAAAGFPMVLELLVQDWRTSREQSLAFGVNAMTSELSTGDFIHTSYIQISKRLYRALDSMSQSVLCLASILGNRLNDLSMYVLVDLTAGQTLTAMSHLVHRRVLRDGSEGLEFVNELLRAAAYLDTPPTLRRVLHDKVADRLIQDHENGSDDLGLSIAWHCMRAGRVHDASNYLLRGATESMRKGAVHEAERALRSALPHLDSAKKQDATMLLVEVLQEQGRWSESLGFLQDIKPDSNDALIKVFSAMAECKSTFLSPVQIRCRLDPLREVIEQHPDVSVRIKAADALCMLLSQLRDQKAAEQYIACLEAIPLTSLDVDDLASLANSKAKMTYTASERPPGLTQVMEIAARLHAKGHVNSHVGNSHVGMGAVACCEGRYMDAKSEFLIAHKIFDSLGNDSARAHQAAQVGVCCIRLGEYEQAIQWSETARPTPETPFRGYMDCQVAFCSGAANALMGQIQKAVDNISWLETRISESVPLWLDQAWGLHKADVLTLSGNFGEACVVARRALDASGQNILHSAFFAGPFARWLALTATDDLEKEHARRQLNEMLEQLSTYDALDQLEILCSRQIVSRRPQVIQDDAFRLIQLKLSELPFPIAEQLTRLGVLTHHWATVIHKDR